MPRVTQPMTCRAVLNSPGHQHPGLMSSHFITQVPRETQKPGGVGGVGKGNVSWPEHRSVALRSGSESKYDYKSRPGPGQPGREGWLCTHLEEGVHLDQLPQHKH